jgi:hypothetical protein
METLSSLSLDDSSPRKVQSSISTEFSLSFAPPLKRRDECCSGESDGDGLNVIFLVATDKIPLIFNNYC